jgi:hypothetical protein
MTLPPASIRKLEVTAPHCPKQAIYVSLELEGLDGLEMFLNHTGNVSILARKKARNNAYMHMKCGRKGHGCRYVCWWYRWSIETSRGSTHPTNGTHTGVRGRRCVAEEGQAWEWRCGVRGWAGARTNTVNGGCTQDGRGIGLGGVPTHTPASCTQRRISCTVALRRECVRLTEPAPSA